MKSYAMDKLTIVGGGIIGAIEAYYAFLAAKAAGKTLRITIHEKNPDHAHTTTGHLVPSLTFAEIVAVIPFGIDLANATQKPFTEPGGLKVDDVPNVNDSDIAQEFIAQAKLCDPDSIKTRRETLLKLGKLSMELWSQFYADAKANADTELKEILIDSNFNPCHEYQDKPNQLHEGYRIDLIYKRANALAIAEAEVQEHLDAGYKKCGLLSPKEVMERDPCLTDFCQNNAVKDTAGEWQWKADAAAIWRPGGCIDAQVFLPRFYEYLRKQMGTYVNKEGITKDCFQLKFNRQVVGVNYENNKPIINGLRFFGREVKQHQTKYQETDYVFCPGESVGTLRELEFAEPAYAGFAGASLILTMDIPDKLAQRYSGINQYMELSNADIGVAWQARIKNNKMVIGVGGGRAFYAGEKPHTEQEFALNRNLAQLNVMNDILPAFLSEALKRDTNGKTLTMEDLLTLEKAGIAKRWVGRRAAAYDVFPTLGALYRGDVKVENARTTTHLGSGGVSFSLATVGASRASLNVEDQSELFKSVLEYGRSNRKQGS